MATKTAHKTHIIVRHEAFPDLPRHTSCTTSAQASNSIKSTGCVRSIHHQPGRLQATAPRLDASLLSGQAANFLTSCSTAACKHSWQRHRIATCLQRDMAQVPSHNNPARWPRWSRKAWYKDGKSNFTLQGVRLKTFLGHLVHLRAISLLSFLLVMRPLQ